MKGKEAEKDAERKKTKLTLDILTIGQMTLKCNRKEKKNPIHLHIDFQSFYCLNPSLPSTQHQGVCVCVCVCVCVGSEEVRPALFSLEKEGE